MHSIIAFPMSKLVQMSNLNFLFHFVEKLFTFDPFWVPGDYDVTGVDKFSKFPNMNSIFAFPISKSVQMPNSTFYSVSLRSYLLLTHFEFLGYVTPQNGVKFSKFSNMDSIIAFPMSTIAFFMSKLVGMQNFNTSYSISLSSKLA